jgi:ribosomal protein S18 acetylase RimI-like enzyme
MSKLTCIGINKIKNPNILTDTIYNNFIYLTKFPELSHNKEEITKSVNSDGSLIYLIYDDRKLIGYLVGDFRTFPDNRFGYYISYFYVGEKYRNRKIGSKLLQNLINRCKRDDIKFIILTCDTFDSKIVNFYKKYGFKEDPVLNTKRRHTVYCLFL